MQSQLPVKQIVKSLYLLILLASSGGVPEFAQAQSYDALEECMALSQVEQEIHNCMDNYLDVMDDNIRDISDFIATDLDSKSLAGFEQSQLAFFEYRKTNCLWYLDFSSPRQQAEYIAKNCLARMSLARLTELQGLLATDKTKNLQRGYYVFGANRNSFQPCGSDQRYWVEGENGLLGQLQQDYLETASVDLQVLYVAIAVTLKDEPGVYAGHAGSATVTAIADLRVPKENDCAMTSASNPTVEAKAAAVEPVVAEPEPTVINNTIDEPEQLLRAYFGDWLAECKQTNDDFSCKLSVAFASSSENNNVVPTLFLNRTSQQRTTLDLVFPEIEIDDPQKILWSVDSYTFGQLQGSRILVDEARSLQQMRERKFIRDELMPLMRDGSTVGVEVLESLDDSSGQKYKASLKGISRAISFADDFISSGGSL